MTIRLEPARFGRAQIIVENPLPLPDQPRRQGNRTALENIRQRLALAYEEGASLKTEKTNAMFRAVLTLPFENRQLTARYQATRCGRLFSVLIAGLGMHFQRYVRGRELGRPFGLVFVLNRRCKPSSDSGQTERAAGPILR